MREMLAGTVGGTIKMRLPILALCLALGASAASAAPKSPWRSIPSDADYEAAEAKVRDRSTGGRAVMRCQIQDGGALEACVVVRETPQGSGYGAALISLAPKFIREPPGKGDPRVVTVPADWYRYDARADWLQRPSEEDLRGVFPRQVINKGADGKAVIHCVVTVQGALQDCLAIEESPVGLGFGDAAIALTPQLMFKPARLNGLPVVSTLSIPINWQGVASMKGQMLTNRVFPPNLPWTDAPSFAQVAAAYPAKAKAERRAGRATVACAMNEEGALIRCSEVSSEPRGYGFAEAAKLLAKQFRMKVESDADRKVTRQFGVHLPFVFDPAMLDGASGVVGKPQWAATPQAKDLTSAFAGLKLTSTARVQLECRVANGGGVEDCRVTSEDPAGSRLGDAALTLTPAFRLTTWTAEGLPVVGGRVRIPLRYEPPQPAAQAPQPTAQ